MEFSALRHAQPELFGREAECARLAEFLLGAHQGRSSVLVLRGEAGIG
jgi:hypothetical protein